MKINQSGIIKYGESRDNYCKTTTSPVDFYYSQSVGRQRVTMVSRCCWLKLQLQFVASGEKRIRNLITLQLTNDCRASGFFYVFFSFYYYTLKESVVVESKKTWGQKKMQAYDRSI